LKNLLPNLAYANDFALNPRPSAHFKLVPGRLTAKDEYARRFYCLSCGQNMESLFIYLHILNMWIILLCMHASAQILNMRIHGESICIVIILVHVRRGSHFSKGGSVIVMEPDRAPRLIFSTCPYKIEIAASCRLPPN
jgi:hypothetical protein